MHTKKQQEAKDGVLILRELKFEKNKGYSKDPVICKNKAGEVQAKFESVRTAAKYLSENVDLDFEYCRNALYKHIKDKTMFCNYFWDFEDQK